MSLQVILLFEKNRFNSIKSSDSVSHQIVKKDLKLIARILGHISLLLGRKKMAEFLQNLIKPVYEKRFPQSIAFLYENFDLSIPQSLVDYSPPVRNETRVNLKKRRSDSQETSQENPVKMFKAESEVETCKENMKNQPIRFKIETEQAKSYKQLKSRTSKIIINSLGQTTSLSRNVTITPVSSKRTAPLRATIDVGRNDSKRMSPFKKVGDKVKVLAFSSPQLVRKKVDCYRFAESP